MPTTRPPRSRYSPVAVRSEHARRIVSRVDVDDLAGARVQDRVEEGDEDAVFRVAVDELVHSRDQFSCGHAALGQRPHRSLHVRHEYRRRCSLPGDIAYRDRQPAVTDVDDVVAVATDVSRGDGEREHVETWKLGEGLGQELHLDVPGDVHLVLQLPSFGRFLLYLRTHLFVRVGDQSDGQREHTVDRQDHEREPHLVEDHQRIDEHRKSTSQNAARDQCQSCQRYPEKRWEPAVSRKHEPRRENRREADHVREHDAHRYETARRDVALGEEVYRPADRKTHQAVRQGPQPHCLGLERPCVLSSS